MTRPGRGCAHHEEGMAAGVQVASAGPLKSADRLLRRRIDAPTALYPRQDPAQLSGAKVDDQMQVVYTQAVDIEITPAK